MREARKTRLLHNFVKNADLTFRSFDFEGGAGLEQTSQERLAARLHNIVHPLRTFLARKRRVGVFAEKKTFAGPVYLAIPPYGAAAAPQAPPPLGELGKIPDSAELRRNLPKLFDCWRKAGAVGGRSCDD